jgi:CheY-like chemotaxis protein
VAFVLLPKKEPYYTFASARSLPERDIAMAGTSIKKLQVIRTLCVDDSATFRSVLILAFAHIPQFEVHVEASSMMAYEEAVRAAIAGEAYNLFVLDIEMPPPDGFLLLQRFRTLPAYKQTPAFFISASEDVEIIERAQREADLLISKKHVESLYLELKKMAMQYCVNKE